MDIFRSLPRITPTCVGNTVINRLNYSNFEDHPHLRGEYCSPVVLSLSKAGSPPLAWGIPGDTACTAHHAGITPTCVGNTRAQDLLSLAVKDHPHLRGEYLPSLIKNTRVEGSPPLAWGILSHLLSSKKQSRITPTCVGNTLSSLCARDCF